MKICIACAESIHDLAQLCKHCGTLQSDTKYLATSNNVPIGGGEGSESSARAEEDKIPVTTLKHTNDSRKTHGNQNVAANGKKLSKVRTTWVLASVILLFIGLGLVTYQVDRWEGVEWWQRSSGNLNLVSPEAQSWTPNLVNIKACFFAKTCPHAGPNSDYTNLIVERIFPGTAETILDTLNSSGVCSFPTVRANRDFGDCTTESGEVEVAVNSFVTILVLELEAPEGLIAGNGWIVYTYNLPISEQDEIATILGGEVLNYGEGS